MDNHLTVDQWVALLQAIGLDQAKMEQWHKLFESRHPAGHQGFLEWLELPPQEIDRIRAKSR